MNIRRLAFSRIRYNRSTTILTMLAIVLTTCLLTAVASMGWGMTQVNLEMAVESIGNHHATFQQLTTAQMETLARHQQLEALDISERFATVVQDKMNASLQYGETRLPGLNTTRELVAGRLPQTSEEIAGPPAFFERLGYDAELGAPVTISFRLQGEGEIIRRDFVICGLFSQVDLSEYDIADTRIAYSAVISQELADSYLAGEERFYTAGLRVRGEGVLNYDELEARVYEVANDIGLNSQDVYINNGYLIWAADPGSETMMMVVLVSLLVVLFSALVIYSIYYVSVITNVQELGKLRALGAGRRQIKSLLLLEGLTLSAVSIPLGLLLGYGVAWLMLHLGYGTGGRAVQLMTWPLALAILFLVLLTVILSLLRPMRLASRVSPMEAIRYQESSGGLVNRKGYTNLSVLRLSLANLSRNRKRTTVTILTLGLGGILFIAASGIAASLSEEDLVRQSMSQGDFMLSLIYEENEQTYVANNLDQLQLTDVMGPQLVAQIEAIPGVSRVERRHSLLAYIDHPAYDSRKRQEIGAFQEADLARIMPSIQEGEADYQPMVETNGLIFPWHSFLEEDGLALGDTISLRLLDGNRELEFTGTLQLSGDLHYTEAFLLPLDTLLPLLEQADSTSHLYIWAEEGAYDAVKTALREIVDPSLHYSLRSLDEELHIAQKALDDIRFSIFLFLLVLGVISFINLINTMITSVVSRRRELGMLQAVGLSDHQLNSMLQQEGFFFTLGSLALALVVGGLLALLGCHWIIQAGVLPMSSFHFPWLPSLILTVALLLGQFSIMLFAKRYLHRQSLVQRMQL